VLYLTVPGGVTVDERFAVLDAVLQAAYDLRESGEGVEVGVSPGGYVFGARSSSRRSALRLAAKASRGLRLRPA